MGRDPMSRKMYHILWYVTVSHTTEYFVWDVFPCYESCIVCSGASFKSQDELFCVGRVPLLRELYCMLWCVLLVARRIILCGT